LVPVIATIPVWSQTGIVIIDAEGAKIVYVEVLGRDDIRRKMPHSFEVDWCRARRRLNTADQSEIALFFSPGADRSQRHP
jgi:hypothetical protein